MRIALFLMALAALVCIPQAAADPEVCPLRNAETEHHCVAIRNAGSQGDALCVEEWNVQHTHGRGRCVFLEPTQ